MSGLLSEAKRQSLFAAFLLLLLGIDAATKYMALGSIPYLVSGPYPFGGVPIWELSWMSFSLNTVTNTGVAWGLLPGYPGLLFCLRVLTILILIGYTIAVQKKREQATWPFWLVAVGAIGNAIDYICYGCVIDFIHWTFLGRSFPLFNFADAYITIGVFFLIFNPMQKQKKIQKEEGRIL